MSVRTTIIEHVIDAQELDRRGTLAGSEVVLATIMSAEADQLALAAHWADLNHPDSLPPAETQFEERRRRLDGDYGVQPGGEGTPEILANQPRELGLVLQTSAGAAKHLIADALDLRHRMPRLWAEVRVGRVRAWKARRVAQATRHLPLSAMTEVDTGLAGLLSSLPWSRFETVLDATVLRADPQGAAHREDEASSRRFVALGRDKTHGLVTLIARGEVLDVLTFLAAVNRIADVLALEGDEDTVEVRRSKAVGILGQPDRALALLTAHQHDTDQPPAPTEPRQRGGWRRRGPRTADAEDEVPDDEGHEQEGEHEHEHDDGHEQEGDHGTSERSLSLSKGSVAELGECTPEPASTAESEPLADEPGERSIDLNRGPTGALKDGPNGAPTASIRVQLYVHLTEAALNGTDPSAVCRVEGVGPVTATTLRRWLGRPEAKVTVRPVVVPGDAIPVDGYEIPQRVREAVLLRNPASGYPWSWCTDRHALQLDHVQPYLAMSRGGPPGQTDPAGLAPLVQTEHQAKTSGSWRERSPAPGVYLWRTPHGWVTLVTNQGTFPLGTSATAQAMWRAAAPAPAGSPTFAASGSAAA